MMTRTPPALDAGRSRLVLRDQQTFSSPFVGGTAPSLREGGPRCKAEADRSRHASLPPAAPLDPRVWLLEERQPYDLTILTRDEKNGLSGRRHPLNRVLVIEEDGGCPSRLRSA